MVYLAMTAAEMRNCSSMPGHMAWMACHFSPYGTGLTNIPASLPPGSLLILNDRTPVCGHDPQLIAQILHQTVDKFECSGILLDFQRPGSQQTEAITSQILTLPCPVCVSETYAKDRDCPILLPPVPLTKTPEEYLFPWTGREIWLEIAMDGEIWTVTAEKSSCRPLFPGEEFPLLHRDAQLMCHYYIETASDTARFVLKRTENDLRRLLDGVQSCGVIHTIGLWQELGR